MPKSILIATLFFLFSCGNTESENSKSLNFVETITFDTGFNGGMQLELINDEEYICISNYSTHKKIVAHSLNSENKHFINLEPIINIGEKINGYEIVNFDTIMVLAAYTNRLYFINEAGNIWKTRDLNYALNQIANPENQYRLSCSHSSTPFQFNDTTMLFSASGYKPNLKNNVRDGTLSPEAYHFAIYRDSLAHILQIDNIYSDSSLVKMGFRNFYDNFVDSLAETIEGHYFTFFEDEIITTSAYSDSLYIIDPKSLIIKEKVKITSRYSEVFIKPITTYESYARDGAHNENYLTDGNIMNLLHDETANLYYCAVMHKPLQSELTDYEFSWSIIVLDGELNQLDEFEIDKEKYGYKVILTRDGLLILNNREYKNEADYFTKNRFALFRYE